MAMETLDHQDHRCVMSTTTNDTPSTRRPGDAERPILVIGASGKTGRRVLQSLVASGRATRAASRTSPTRFDWDEPRTWAPALAGAGAAYVVAPERPTDVDRFLAEASNAGLERLVLLSARHPEQGGDGVMPAIEAAVRSGPLPATVLQPSWFVQNFTEGMFVHEVADGVLSLPVGQGREPFIDTADIAAVAVAALTDGRHAGATYELSGPESMTFDDAVRRLGAASGRDLRFEPVEPGPWADAAAAFLPAPVVELLLNLFAAIRDGDNDHLSLGVEHALGRAPHSFEQALDETT